MVTAQSGSLSSGRTAGLRFSLRGLMILIATFAVGIAIGVARSVEAVVVLSLVVALSILVALLSRGRASATTRSPKVVATLDISGDIGSLARRSIIVGRASRCDIVLTDKAVSSHHCRIYVVDGEVYIEDLESLNGTLLNGKPIRRKRLRVGDTVTIGDCQLGIQ